MSTDEDELLPQALEAAGFLSALYPPGKEFDGHLALWSRQTGASFHFPVSQVEAAAACAVERIDAASQCAYVGLGARVGGLDSAHRGKAGDVVAIPGLWVDLDLVAPPGVHKATNLPPDVDSALALLDEVPLEPSVVVSSGYGLHAHVLLDEPCVFAPGEGVLAARLVRAYQARLKAAAEAHGWRVDSTHNLAQVLRIPGTRNHKRPEAPQPVRVLFAQNLRYTLAQLEQVLIRPVGRPPKASGGPSPGSQEPAGASTPSPGAPQAPASPGDALASLRDALAKYRGGGEADPEARADRVRRIKLLLAGQSFADPGERDTSMQLVASVVAFHDAVTPAAVIAEGLFRPSLALWAAEPDAGLSLDEELAKVTDKLERAQEAKRQADKDARARLVTATRAVRRAVRDKLGISEADTAEDAEDPEGEVDDGTYTDADVVAIARLQGYPGSDFDEARRYLRKRWVIQHGDAYWILAGDYQSPVGSTELVVKLRDDWLPAIPRLVDLWVEKADGKGERLIKPAEVMFEYGTVARKIVAHVDLQSSRYDEGEETFHEAIAPLRRLEPRYDPQIHAWLLLLLAQDPQRGLDWLATLTRLDRPNAALYLQGPRATGKSMLTLGAARLWADTPTELWRVLDTPFNADLARCPLVVADEKMGHQEGTQRAVRSEALRLLVGSTSRALSRKYIANSDLVGAVRVLIVANNDRMLQFGDADLGADDLDAIAERVLHLEHGTAPRDYLQSIGGAAATRDWVRGDLIARHLLWLRDSRQVADTGRFMVEGHITQTVRQLATLARTPSLVAEWVVRCVRQQPIPPALAQRKTVRIGGGRVLVTTDAPAQCWEMFVNSENRRPATGRIARALRQLALSDSPIVIENGQEYFNLDPTVLAAYGAQTQLLSPEAFAAIVNRPIATGSAVDSVLKAV